MPQTNQTPRGNAGLDQSFSLLRDNREIARNSASTQAEILRNPAAAREAKLELLRESIFESLGAVRLFIETAQLLIDARDDAGVCHSIRMGALHFKAAVASANELSSVKGEACG